MSAAARRSPTHVARESKRGRRGADADNDDDAGDGDTGGAAEDVGGERKSAAAADAATGGRVRLHAEWNGAQVLLPTRMGSAREAAEHYARLSPFHSRGTRPNPGYYERETTPGTSMYCGNKGYIVQSLLYQMAHGAAQPGYASPYGYSRLGTLCECMRVGKGLSQWKRNGGEGKRDGRQGRADERPGGLPGTEPHRAAEGGAPDRGESKGEVGVADIGALRIPPQPQAPPPPPPPQPGPARRRDRPRQTRRSREVSPVREMPARAARRTGRRTRRAPEKLDYGPGHVQR